MSDERDYEVGYGKPPRHSRFLPGQSGFKGRKKRKPETQAQIVARVRDELVTINGETMTKFELAVRSVIAQTVKGGKPRELKVMLELLAQYGATPQVEAAMESKAAADKVIGTIMNVFHRSKGRSLEDVEALQKCNEQQAELVYGCDHCGPKLRETWKTPEYRALKERYMGSSIHRHLIDGREKRNSSNGQSES